MPWETKNSRLPHFLRNKTHYCRRLERLAKKKVRLFWANSYSGSISFVSKLLKQLYQRD